MPSVQQQRGEAHAAVVGLIASGGHPVAIHSIVSDLPRPQLELAAIIACSMLRGCLQHQANQPGGRPLDEFLQEAGLLAAQMQT